MVSFTLTAKDKAVVDKTELRYFFLSSRNRRENSSSRTVNIPLPKHVSWADCWTVPKSQHNKVQNEPSWWLRGNTWSVFYSPGSEHSAGDMHGSELPAHGVGVLEASARHWMAWGAKWSLKSGNFSY